MPDRPDPADAPDAADVQGLEPGARVEVRTGFDQSWTSGFAIAEVTEQGYRLRRRSDDHVLPVEFPFDAVRRERRSMWWI
jgi:hypothetical protein